MAQDDISPDAPPTPYNTRDFIVQEALARKLDPAEALAVAGTEGGHGVFKIGDSGTSGGPFQLHVRGTKPGTRVAGMGDDFRRETGLDPLDPKNEAATIRYALDYVAKHGGHFDPNIWHGARNLKGGTGNFGMANANLPADPFDPNPTPVDAVQTAQAPAAPRVDPAVVTAMLNDSELGGGTLADTISKAWLKYGQPAAARAPSPFGQVGVSSPLPTSGPITRPLS